MKKIVATLAALFLMSTFAMTGHAQMFKDIPNDSDSFYEVNYLINKEVISGYGDGTFRPDALIQKQHIAKMLVQALGLPTDNVTNPNYADVPTDALYYKEIAAAQNEGLFDATTYFKPESTITRAEMAEVLARAYHLEVPADYEAAFTDITTSTPSYNAIVAVAATGISVGAPDSKQPGALIFMPNKELTRMHFTAFLARAMTLKPYTFSLQESPVYEYEVITANGTTQKLMYEYLEPFRWTVSNLTDAVTYPTYIEQESANHYKMQAMVANQRDLVVQKPIRIGTQPKSEANANTTVTVISTMAKTTIGSKAYTDLVLVEQYDHTTKNIYHYYFAEGKGLIKQALVAVGAQTQLTPDTVVIKQLVE